MERWSRSLNITSSLQNLSHSSNGVSQMWSLLELAAYESGHKDSFDCIQLFRKRLSEKVHATIPKGIVGGFEFTVLSKKFERMAREAMDVCLRVLKESNKSRFDSLSVVRNGVLIISHITFRDCRVHIFPTTFLEIVLYFFSNLFI